MKKYKLLHELPFAKAGDMVEMWSDGTMTFVGEPNLPRFNKEDIRMFPQWFKEVERVIVPDKYYYIDLISDMIFSSAKDGFASDEKREAMFQNCSKNGIAFETFMEAEEYLKYLRAKEVIKQDTKGFKPNWKNCENKYYGYWNSGKDSLGYLVSYITKYSDICFKTEEDIKESFKKHPDEWKTYLTYEQ